MFRYKLLKAVVFLTFLIALSCSVKEDRSPCPCYLNLNIDQAVNDPDYEEGLVTVMTHENMICQERVRLSDYEGAGYDVVVPRKLINAMVAVGHEDLWWKSDTLSAATNLEWGPVRLAGESDLCDADDKRFVMQFHKEYCRMNFILVGVVDVDSYPFDIRIRANCNALRLRDRKPVRGRYTAYAVPSNTAMYSVLVPRQEDSEMLVDLLLHKESHEYTVDDYVATIEVGSIMARQGYNWDKIDLDDIYVNIDVLKATCSIGIVPWDEITVEEVI